MNFYFSFDSYHLGECQLIWMELFGRIESAFDRKHSGMNILKTRNSQNSFLFQFSNKNCIQNKYDKLSLLDQSIRRIGFWMRYERFVKPTSHFYSCLVRIFFFFAKQNKNQEKYSFLFQWIEMKTFICCFSNDANVSIVWMQTDIRIVLF